MGKKKGFSDGKKLFHLIVLKPRYGAEPVTRRDTKMAAEFVTVGTDIKYEKSVNGTRNSVQNVPTGKTGVPF